MIHKSITVEDALEVLNRAAKTDPEAMESLRNAQVYCNEALADDPTIQVNSYSEKGKTKVGFLGIINGLFGIDDESGMGAICMAYNVDCPKCGPTGEDVDVQLGDPCPKCGDILITGKFLDFRRTNAK